MFADIETLAHGIRHEAFKNGQRLKKISNTDSAERSAFFNKNSLGAGMATSLTNENRSKRNSINSFQNAITYMQTQEKLLKQSEDVYNKMRDLASKASNPILSQSDRDVLNNEFIRLQDHSLSLSRIKLNDNPLFNDLASAKKYKVNFTSGLTNDTPEDELIDSNNNGQYDNGEKRIWERERDVVYNSGKLKIKVNSGVIGDRYILKQGGDIIFDTGSWRTRGNAKNYDYDEFEVEWGPGQDTKLKFYANSLGGIDEVKLVDNSGTKISLEEALSDNGVYDNKSYYLDQLGWDSDGSPSGIQSREGIDISNEVEQVETFQSTNPSSILTLRIESETLFQIDSDPFELPDLDMEYVGNEKDMQVEVHPLGLGLLRSGDQDKDFELLNLNSVEDAAIAISNLTDEIEGIGIQFGRLSSSFSRVEAAIRVAESHIGGSEKTLSQITNAGMEDDALAISKSRIYRSKSAALLTQAMSVNQDVANFLL